MWGKLFKWASAIKGKSSEIYGWLSKVSKIGGKKVNPVFDSKSETCEVKLERMSSNVLVRTYIPSENNDLEQMQRDLLSGSGDENDTDDEGNVTNYNNEEIDEEFLSRRSSQLDSVAIGEEDHDYPPIFKLNSDCRRKIYEFLLLKDVPNVRQVCRFIKEDIDQLKGVRITMNDDTFYQDDLELISTLGIRYMSIRKLVSSSLEGIQIKYPTILTSLSISGPITKVNYLFIMDTCENIKRFSIEIKSSTFQATHQSNQLCHFKDITAYPKKLRVFRIAPTCLGISHLNEISEENFSILDRIKSNYLHRFIFQALFSNTPPNLNDFHLSCLKCIRYHAHSLKSIIINVKIMNPASVEDSEFSEGRFVLGSSDRNANTNTASTSNSNVIDNVKNWASIVKLKDFRLRTDHFFSTMYLPLIEQQTDLEKLDLHIKNLDWGLISPIISKCSGTLKSIRLANLYFPTPAAIIENRNTNTVTHQIDLMVVAGCDKLDTLSLAHQENPRIVNCQLSNWSQLPESIQKLTFNKIRISPRQIFGMIKNLKNLTRLDLILWSHDDISFLSFFNHLSYFMASNFIKDPTETMPSLNLINLFEHRSRFEKYSRTIDNCKRNLENILNVSFSEHIIQHTHLEFSIEIHPQRSSNSVDNNNEESTRVTSSAFGLDE